jgi:hypothetical protein
MAQRSMEEAVFMLQLNSLAFQVFAGEKTR